MSLVRATFLFVFAVAVACQAFAQYFEQPSSFFLEAGLGFFPYLTYGSALDAALSSSSTSRFQVDLEGRFGWAIAPRLYAVGGYDAVMDDFFNNGTWANEINSGLISLGFRFYPFRSGLFLEMDGGVSQLDGFTAWGYGVEGVLAWDFSPLGLNLEAGAKSVYLSFQSSNPSFIFAAMPFVAITIK